MANIYMIRRKTDGKYIRGSPRYPWFVEDIGRTFYNIRSAQIWLTSYLNRYKIKTWKNGRYRFNAGEFFTPSNILIDCEIVTIEVKPTTLKSVFDFSAELEMKNGKRTKKAKTNEAKE